MLPPSSNLNLFTSLPSFWKEVLTSAAIEDLQHSIAIQAMCSRFAFLAFDFIFYLSWGSSSAAEVNSSVENEGNSVNEVGSFRRKDYHIF